MPFVTKEKQINFAKFLVEPFEGSISLHCALINMRTLEKK